MLKPASFDPNWASEQTRYNKDPHAFGAPKVRIATTQEQRVVTSTNIGDRNHGSRTR